MGELGRNPRTDRTKWEGMDPKVRERFHEFGDAMSRIEGMVTAMMVRVPEKPGDVPVLAEKVRHLELGQSDMKVQITDTDKKLSTKIDNVESKLDSLTLRVVGGTTVLTTIATIVVNVLTR